MHGKRYAFLAAERPGSTAKRALLGALKPFVAEEVSGQFDRALRLVSMARMARAALGQVNLSADDTAPRAL